MLSAKPPTVSLSEDRFTEEPPNAWMFKQVAGKGRRGYLVLSLDHDILLIDLLGQYALRKYSDPSE